MLFLYSLLGAAFAAADVSGFNKISTNGANFYDGAAAVDQKADTAWMTAADSKEEMEWIQIDAPNQKSKLTQIRVINGYAKDEQTFKDYSKIEKLKIEAFQYNEAMELYSTKSTVTVELKNTAEPQVITLPKPVEIKSNNGGKYRFWIAEVHKTGTENYPENIALTEISMFLEDEEVGPKIASEENVPDGEDIFNALDGKKSTILKVTSETVLGFEGVDCALTRVQIIPTKDKRYARPKKIKVTTGGRETIQEFPEKLSRKQKVPWIWLPSVTGYPGGSSGWDETTIQVIETYPGTKYEEIGIAEMKFRAILDKTLDGLDLE